MPLTTHVRPDRWRARATLLASFALAATVIGAPLSADDTEIFFGQADPNKDYRPNLLFVFDTSGSMNWGEDNSSPDTGEQSRIQILRSAMNKVLDQSSNVNIGMMRMNGLNGGAAVIYPMSGIDDNICDGGSCGSLNESSQVATSTDNAEEHDDTGYSFHTGTHLSLGMNHAGHGTQSQHVGLRFGDLDIPQGATITDARIDFTAILDDSDVSLLTFEIESDTDVDPHTAGTNTISTRPVRSGVSTTWSPGPWTKDEVYESSNLAPLVQAAVNDTGWCGGQAIGFVITGSGNRDAYTYVTNTSGGAPALRVTYSLDSTTTGTGCQIATTSAAVKNATDDAWERTSNGRVKHDSNKLFTPENNKGRPFVIGLRFRDVPLPQGADLIDARLTLTSASNRNDAVSLTIEAEQSDDAPAFKSGNGEYDISNRTVGASIAWPSLPQRDTGEKYVSDNLVSILQPVVSRPGWETNNALVLRIDGSAGASEDRREFVSYDDDPIEAAQLQITYKSYGLTSSTGNVLARDRMKSTIDNLRATGGTPVVGSLLEAARYMTGGAVGTGKTRGNSSVTWKGNNYGDQRSSDHRVSHRDSYVGSDSIANAICATNPRDWRCKSEYIPGSATYKPIITKSCQANTVVLLTDGAPSSARRDAEVEAMIGTTCEDGATNDATCATDIARWMANTDLAPTVPGVQSVTTHTVNFNLAYDPDTTDASTLANQAVLTGIAAAGNGEMFDAADDDDLVKAFQTIMSEVMSIDTAFTAPGATVNQYNRLTHRGDIYFALFKPDDRPLWDGNLKRYSVGTITNEDGTTESGIVDANNRAAVDPATGFFREDAVSVWTPKTDNGTTLSNVDGKTVGLGGVAHRMPEPDLRNIYTYLGDSSAIPATGLDLTVDAEHIFHEDNAGITADLLAIGNDVGTATQKAEYRTRLMRWARGRDVLDVDNDGLFEEDRRHVGDPMHSRPVILNYPGDESRIFLATNEGYMHAIDTHADSGTEKFAFVPKHLLGNFERFFENDGSGASRPYGLDGVMSVKRDDNNQNYIVDGTDQAMLYLGMRRGGNNYYAFDVSTLDKAKLAWTIEGGSAGFEQLGQTWSRATPARMRIDGTEKDVLIFGAGYDDNQDHDPDSLLRTQSPDSIGRGLYIVDANTGAKLWSFLGVSGGDQLSADMRFSIPADVRVIDIDFDGLADQLYTTDMGGQVWRFDVNPSHDADVAEQDELLAGGVMAKLASSALDGSGHRRFYNEPDVALIEKDGARFMAISIGSGWRAHPLDKIVQDRFYVIKSDAVRNAPAGYGRYDELTSSWRPIVNADLIDVAAAGSDIPATNRFGWFLDFANSGEKVLGKSVTFDSSVVFSTYVPDVLATANPCAPSIGAGRAYVLSAVNGYPTRNLGSVNNSQDWSVREDKDDTIDVNDRSVNLMHGGIPPEPAILITGDGSPLVVIGPEKLDAGFNNGTKRTFWADHGATNPQLGAATVPPQPDADAAP